MKSSAAICFRTAVCVLTLALPVKPVWADTAPESMAIEFQLADDNLQQFDGAAVAAELVQRVRGNLAEWEFPLPAAGPYSHRLLARLGSVARRETPVGFSFTSGNSDPRAVDFQKADVLPIHCELRTADSRTLLYQSESTFSAHAFDKPSGKRAVADKLADQISTACLDVLEHAKLPKPQNRVKTVLFKPKWMPEVRVEKRQIPAGSPSQAVDGAAGEAEEAKQEVIIHNQGTPLILQFGHERR